MNETTTRYIKLLQERDRWMAAYSILFTTNEEHIKRLEYFAKQLSPEPPCRLDGDDIEELEEI